jgi:hypothetical protein
MTPPVAAAAPAVHPRRAPQAPARRPRRVSGPGARPVRRAREVASPAIQPTAHPLFDRLIHGRAWIGIVAFALIGIVTMQLGLLKLNAGIGRALEHETALQRENSALSVENSEVAAGNTVELQAAHMGMRSIPAGGLRFLSAPGSGGEAAVIARAGAALNARASGASASSSATPASGEAETPSASTSESTAPTETTASATTPSTTPTEATESATAPGEGSTTAPTQASPPTSTTGESGGASPGPSPQG